MVALRYRLQRSWVLECWIFTKLQFVTVARIDKINNRDSTALGILNYLPSFSPHCGFRGASEPETQAPSSSWADQMEDEEASKITPGQPLIVCTW